MGNPAMAEKQSTEHPNPTPDQRRIAAGQFERANQVLASGNHDYAIQLLLNCCKLDPANLIYRQALRKTQKAKYRNNLRGSRFALLTAAAAKLRLKAARKAGDLLKVLEQGELILTRNPWDLGAQLAMAEAFDALGLLDAAIWTLEQARHKDPQNVKVNRDLALLLERRGNFKQAITLWELIKKVDPGNAEAMSKAKDLAASDTIARGHYEHLLHRPAEAAEEDEDEQAPEGDGDSAEAEAAAYVAAGGGDRVAREAAPLLARIKHEPGNAGLYLQLADVYRRLEHLDQARAILQQGLSATGNQFELAVELAALEIEPFRQNLALADARLQAQPEDERLKKIRIRLLKEINARELELYRQKADRYPTDMTSRFELGVRLLRAGQVDEAIRELQVARSDPRHHGRALYYLGYCFRNRKNWRLAQRNFEEALQSLGPGDEGMRKEVLFQLAQGCAEAGDLARAVDMAYELANLDWGYKDIGRLLDAWQARLTQADSGEASE
jgi:Flp pilus assembly protein TadD